MDFFEKTGKLAIGSRLRILTDIITRDAAAIYELYGLDFKPKWFPVFYSLVDEKPQSITMIAKEIGQSHPSVSTIVKEMLSKEIVTEVEDPEDRRRSLICLSEKGKRIAHELIVWLRDVNRAVEQISDESEHDLWGAIADWERLLAQKSLLQRVKDIKKERESGEVEIVPFSDCHREAFYELNRQWIERYWSLEPHDIEVLENPDKHILSQGGYIFVALYSGRPVGVCSLCKMDSSTGYDYELAKLAVDTTILRKGIGRRLCEAVISKARSLGATTLFLESNTRLKPAIALYRKLGFKELPEFHPAYARGDIQMDMKLREDVNK